MRPLPSEREIPTAFLPEHDSVTSADAISRINGHWKILDFKYCVSTKWNTIQADLKTAFLQGDGAVIQLKNADAGQFKAAIEYLYRNKMPLKDIVIINEYGKIVELSYQDLKNGKYAKKIKGLL